MSFHKKVQFYTIQNQIKMSNNQSPIWKYFHHKENDSEKVVCKICEKEYKCKGGVTTPLHNHLKNHSKEYHEFEEAKNSKRTYSPKASKQSTLENMFPKSNESTMKVLDDKIVDFLADSGVAFRTIGFQSFKDVIASVNNKVEVKSRVFYSKLEMSLEKQLEPQMKIV